MADYRYPSFLGSWYFAGMTGPSEDEVSSFRMELDEFAAKQAEEIKRLRDRLAVLEGASRKASAPPPLPRAMDETPAASDPIPAPERKVSAAMPGFTPSPKLESKPESQPEVVPVVDEVPKPESGGSFELNLGRVWLVRLGIVLLVTGLVLLGNYAYRNWIRELPAVVRLVFLFAGSFVLVGTGWWFTLKEGMKRFGEVLLAGGLAFFYWCTFAAHHVDRLRVIDSPVVGAVLLLIAAGGIVGVSLRRDAPATAVMGLLLASYSTVLQPLGWLSAVSNVVLSAAAIGLMRKPGWTGPGLAGMASTYLAYLWLQLGGAAGGSVSSVDLYFLPASWAIFALPGITGLPGDFGKSLSDRGRAWFAGVNNGAFFGLFSLLWLVLEYGDYWRVPAVFGLVILVLGAATRKIGYAGSTHVAQGLGLLTLALALKLEGYHLVLGLAMEALMLAVVFLRFRRPLEMFFSMLAQVGALISILYFKDAPVWPSGMAGLLVAASAVLLRIGSRRIEESGQIKEASTLAASFGLVIATMIGGLWCVKLDQEWRGMTSLALALAFTGLAMKGDRRSWLPELRGMGAAFALLGGGLLVYFCGVLESWHWLACVLMAGMGAVLWERRAETVRRMPVGGWEEASGMAWVFGLITAWSLVWSIVSLDWPTRQQVLAGVVMVPGVAFLAMRVLGSPRLRTAISLTLLMPLVMSLFLGSRHEWLQFLVPLSALATLLGTRKGPVSEPKADALCGFVTRSVALLGWVTAWMNNLPDLCLEVLAITGVALIFWKKRMPGLRLPESWILLVGTGVGLLVLFADASWSRRGSTELQDGWAVVLAFVATALMRLRLRVATEGVNLALRWISAAFVILWSTLTLVQETGWSGVVILWALLGFTLVGGGLWLRFASWRHAGFALLAVALVKLFAVDVWDFGAFTRVVAFLALGVALVALGFFYNRFADILKRLLDGEGSAEFRNSSDA
ncbi:MAG: DUF2339 domain-containing protein [Verrucomicrobiota bacterium]